MNFIFTLCFNLIFVVEFIIPNAINISDYQKLKEEKKYMNNNEICNLIKTIKKFILSVKIEWMFISSNNNKLSNNFFMIIKNTYLII